MPNRSRLSTSGVELGGFPVELISIIADVGQSSPPTQELPLQNPPLVWATRKGRERVAKKLMNVSKEACSCQYRNALEHLAFIEDAGTISLLITNAVKTDGDFWNHTFANANLLCGLSFKIRFGRADVVSNFIQAKYPALGWLLKVAISYRQVKIAKILLEGGASVNSRGIAELDPYGSTSLHLAAYRGDIGIMEFLLDAGADIERRDNTNRTPIWYAIHLSPVRSQSVVYMVIAVLRMEVWKLSDFSCGVAPT